MSYAAASLTTLMPAIAPVQTDFPAAENAGALDPAAAEQLRSRREDEDLVARSQTGDAGAFDVLVVKHSPRLYGLVYHMTSNHEDANDLLQDVWAKAYRSIGGFRGKSQLYTWLHSIAANTTLNFLKKRGRRRTVSLDDIDNGIANDKEFTELQSTSTPVREAGLAELQIKINEAMQRLSHEHRMVVTMFDIRGMSHAEIGKILGLGEGTVRSRLFYAHRELQAWLAEFAPTPST